MLGGVRICPDLVVLTLVFPLSFPNGPFFIDKKGNAFKAGVGSLFLVSLGRNSIITFLHIQVV